MIRLLLDLAAMVCLLTTAVATVVHVVGFVRLVRADTKRWRSEAEAHAKQTADRDAFLQDMRRRHGQEAFRQ